MTTRSQVLLLNSDIKSLQIVLWGIVWVMFANYSSSPFRFDPDRFSPENKKNRPSLAFQPFGFAGKRICPGYRFAYAEAIVCFVTLLRKFKVKMVEGQMVSPVFGLVTHPEEEIWITIEKR